MNLNIILVILFVISLLFFALRYESTRELFTTYDYTGKDGLIISTNTESNTTNFKKSEGEDSLLLIDNQTGIIKTNVLKADNINLNKINDANSLDFQDIYKLETNGIESVDGSLDGSIDGSIDVDNDISVIGEINSSEKITIEGKTNLDKLEIGDYSLIHDSQSNSMKITSKDDENVLKDVSINDVEFPDDASIIGTASNNSTFNITGNPKAEFNNLQVNGNYQAETIDAVNDATIQGNAKNVTTLSTNKLEIQKKAEIDTLYNSVSNINTKNSSIEFRKNASNPNIINSTKSMLGNSFISEYLHTNIIDLHSDSDLEQINIVPGIDMKKKNIKLGEEPQNDNILIGKNATFKNKIVLNKDFCVPDANNPDEQKCITINQIENLDALNKSNNKTLNVVETTPYKLQGCYKIGQNVGYPRLGLLSDDPGQKMTAEKCFEACPPGAYTKMGFHKDGFCTCGNEEDINEDDLFELEKCRSISGELRGNSKFTLVYEYKAQQNTQKAL